MDTLVGKLVNLENRIRNPAITTKNVDPKIVSLDNILLTCFFVSSPVLIPGMFPPLSCKFFANSSGFT